MFKINVRELAVKKDWNVSDLWRATGGETDGVSYNTLLAYWHEYVKRTNIKDLIKLCDALECDLSELLQYSPDKK
jgi:DNA-binding Xre family transcriptional regulator